MLTAAAGAGRYGLRARYRPSYMTRWNGSLLPQTNVRPQSSMLMPCCPPPLVSSNVVGARVEQEALAADRALASRPSPSAGRTLPPAQAGRDVEAVVEPPAERVEHRLAGVVAAEPGEDDPAHVGLAVAVGVLAVEMSGTQPTKTPPSQQATAAGDRRLSAKTVLLSKLPSPSVSSSSRTQPRPWGFVLAYWLYSGNSAT